MSTENLTSPSLLPASTELSAAQLTHFDSAGQAHMVDVAAKVPTHRVAKASGRIEMLPATFELIAQGGSKKGDVLGIARIAGIQAAKKTSELIPLCHPLALTRIALEFEPLPGTPSNVCEQPPDRVACAAARPAWRCRATVETVGVTGVEMEALCAVQVALLTIYDMCKAVDKGMRMSDIRLDEKTGGKSGVYLREPDAD